MFKSARKCQVLIVLLFLSLLLVQPSKAESADSTAKEKVPEFVSEVFGLDMTKYNITVDGSGDGYGFHYPPEYGGVAKEESMAFNLVSNKGTIYTVHIWGLFLNGFICSLNVDAPTSVPMFFVDPPTSALDESKNILQRYKTFAEKYGFDTSHVDSALTLLNAVTSASSINPDLNILNNITGFVPSVTTVGNMKQETTEDSITWIYTDRGVDMPNRCMKIDFGHRDLRFVDTWNLFTVGCFSAISEDEALRICWEAAKNYNLTLIGEDGPYNPEFEWSNRTFVKLNMVPGQIHNITAEDYSVSGGNITRDPMALYPSWFMVFYFKKHVPAGQRSIAGITVGLWGDTKEISSVGITSGTSYSDGVIRINPYVTSTEPSPDIPDENSTTPTEPPPESTPTDNPPSENPTESDSSNPPSNMYIIGGIAAATIIAIAVAAVALKKRRK